MLTALLNLLFGVVSAPLYIDIIHRVFFEDGAFPLIPFSHSLFVGFLNAIPVTTAVHSTRPRTVQRVSPSSHVLGVLETSVISRKLLLGVLIAGLLVSFVEGRISV